MFLTVDSGMKASPHHKQHICMLFSCSLEFQRKWKTLQCKLRRLQSIDLDSSKEEYEILFFPSHAGMIVLSRP